MTDEESVGFKSSADRLDEEAAARVKFREKNLTTGIPYLDAVWRGISPHDLVLIGAPTGVGKTALITQIAYHNAIQGKRVHVFALEAEPAEIERRMLFQEVTELYYKAGGTCALNFRDWVYGDYDELLKQHEAEAKARLGKLNNLFTYYRDSDFTIQDYERKYNFIQSRSDLIICDHLHFFSLTGDDELKEISQIIKKKRDLTLIHGVPQIIVAHLRKRHKQDDIVPDISDFIGTSDLSKVPTKIAVLASGGPSMRSPDEFITYFRIGKFRLFGAPTAYIGATTFDIRRNIYSNDFKVGKLSKDGKSFEETPAHQLPSWLKHRG
jgi:replicative DNA helicase